jgi:hypothetical protein
MIDVYAPAGTYTEANVAALLRRVVDALLVWTDATEIPFVRRNAGAYFHALPPAHVTSDGVPDVVVRIDVTLPEVVLSTIERRRGFIADATAISGELSGPAHTAERTWIAIVNTVDAGWGIGGHALTNAEIDDI